MPFALNCNYLVKQNFVCGCLRLFSRSHSANSGFFHQVLKTDLLEHLTHRQFLSAHGNSVGVLGKEILLNIESEWRRCNVVGKNVRDVGNVDLMRRNSIDNQVHDAIFDHVTLNNLSVTSGSMFAASLQDSDSLNRILALVKFVEESSANLQFENLHSEKIWWIKNYLRKPALVGTDWGPNLESIHSSTMKEVRTRYELGDITVQHSTMIGPDQLEAIPRVCSKDVPVSMVIIRHSLFDLLATILADSYHHVDFPEYNRVMLRLHPHLAPIKSAVSIQGQPSPQLKQLAQEMINWLRRMNVSCWGVAEFGVDETDLDHCGVPYVFILSAKTLDDGILIVRHRDSSLMVQAHISEVMTKLKLYLQPR